MRPWRAAMCSRSGRRSEGSAFSTKLIADSAFIIHWEVQVAATHAENAGNDWRQEFDLIATLVVKHLWEGEMAVSAM